MKTEKPKLSTSESATKTPLWQEIPEDSAETLKGGTSRLRAYKIKDYQIY